jgi:hypothetical protein
MTSFSLSCSLPERNLHLPIGSAAPIVEMAIADPIAGAAAIIRKVSDDRRTRIVDHELVAYDETIAKRFLGNRRMRQQHGETNR